MTKQIQQINTPVDELNPTEDDLQLVFDVLERHVWSKPKIQAVVLTQDQERFLSWINISRLMERMFKRSKLDDQRAHPSKHQYLTNLFHLFNMSSDRLYAQRASYKNDIKC